MEQQKIMLLAEFLRQFGLFGGVLTVDRVGLAPGSVGLFPGGQSEELLRRDILGHSLYDCTWHFALRYRAVSGQDAAEHLERFTLWLQERSDKGLCPAFGDNTRITAGKCKLTDARTDGCDLYEMELTVTATVSR